MNRVDLSEYNGLQRQIWFEVKSDDVERHFVLVGEKGAVCFRIGAEKLLCRFHARESTGHEIRVNEDCELLDGDRCYFHHLSPAEAEQARRELAVSAHELWRYLLDLYESLNW